MLDRILYVSTFLVIEFIYDTILGTTRNVNIKLYDNSYFNKS